MANEELPDLSRDEIARYSRHLILPEVRIDGQKKLKNAKVLMIGTGGLGAPLGMYLAAAGVGTLGIVDFDVVDTSNLQRQIIHGTRDVGRPKVASAKDRIKNLNPHVNVVTYDTFLTSENALDLFKDYDIIVDGTDNYQTRYLVNDACVLLGKPNVYGSIFRFEGQASVFGAKGHGCYRCLYPEAPPAGLVPSCSEGGVLGVLPGIVGTIQATEVIKLILGGGDSLTDRLLLIDAWSMKFRELKLKRDPHCPICGDNPTIHELGDYDAFCGIKPHDDEPELKVENITPNELKKRLDEGEQIQIIDTREPHEFAIVKIEGSKSIPFGQIVRRRTELDPTIPTVIACKVGLRSADAISALVEAGYAGHLLNLKDGIIGWAEQVDRSLPTY